jgi:hypothetical protein
VLNVSNENSSDLPPHLGETEQGETPDSENQKKARPWFLTAGALGLFAGLVLILILFELLPR